MAHGVICRLSEGPEFYPHSLQGAESSTLTTVSCCGRAERGKFIQL